MVTIIVPVGPYEDEQKVNKFISYLKKYGKVIAVLDGANLNINADTVIKLRKNRGKWFAIYIGLKKSIDDIIGFVDADGEIPYEIVEKCIEACRNGFDLVFVKRNTIKYWKSIRKLFNRLFRLIILLFFNIKEDIQCGCKFARYHVWKKFLEEKKSLGWLTDLELYLIAQKYKYNIRPMEFNGIIFINSKPKKKFILNSIYQFIKILLKYKFRF